MTLLRLAEKLNISSETLKKTQEEFALMQERFTSVGSQPMLHPLPLCNNNLRPDTKHESNGLCRINIGRLHRFSKEADPTGLNVMQRSSLIRTESLSWEGMLKSALTRAEKDENFAELFKSDTLDGIDSNISSMCMGVPFAVSQDIYVAGRSCSWRPGFSVDSDAVASLKINGAVPIGYIKRTPFDRDVAPYAVANGSIPFALSVDHLGSSLVAAAKAGVVGIRPTYGICSRMGLVSDAPSMHALCLHANDVHSAYIALECIMHGKHNDCTSHRATLGDWYEWISCFDVRKRTLGVARNLLDMRSSPRASAEVIKSAELLNLVGTNIVDIEAPLCNDPLLIRALVAAESRYDDILKIMNASPLDIPEEKRANMLLKYMLLDEGTTLHNARCIRNMHAQNMERLLSGMDWFICPTVYDDSTPSPALSSLSLAGICGITIPCGSTVEGHRLGLLFISRQFSESNQLGLCNYLERSNNMLKGVPRRGRHCKIQN